MIGLFGTILDSKTTQHKLRQIPWQDSWQMLMVQCIAFGKRREIEVRPHGVECLMWCRSRWLLFTARCGVNLDETNDIC